MSEELEGTVQDSLKETAKLLLDIAGGKKKIKNKEVKILLCSIVSVLCTLKAAELDSGDFEVPSDLYI